MYKILLVLLDIVYGIVDLFVFALFVLAMLVLPAEAATVTLQPVFEDWLNPLIVDLLGGLSMLVLFWVMWVFHKYITPILGAQLETKASKDLNTALENGTTIIMNKLVAWETAHKDVKLQNQIGAWAAQYALNHAADAVGAFGLSPGQLATKALAYIKPPPTSIDTTGLTINNSNVEVKELPPIK